VANIVSEIDRLSVTYQLPSAEAFHVHLRQVVSAAFGAIALARSHARESRREVR
jgi:hypothetical protein